MMDINNINWDALSDNTLLSVVGAYIKHHRLEQNKTQHKLAEEAGINRSTLVEFEKGKRSNLITFIQLLRALDLLYVMDQFKIIQQLSPMQLAEIEQAKRKRARKTNTKDKKRVSGW